MTQTTRFQPTRVDRRLGGPVPLLDVNRQNEPLLDDLLAATERILRSGRFVLGAECERLEAQVAEVCGSRFGIGCASGSDALLLSLMALEIQPGSEVIVPSFTFFATASAVSRLGAVPVFVDIDPVTFNLAPEQVIAAITERTVAIIPVHLFGQCADMQPLQDVAAEYDLKLVEDAAQSIGARYHDQPCGALGDLACLSFYPTKNLGGCGDGGMVTTSEPELAERIRLLRGHGMEPRYFHKEVGINSRLDAIQAALLLAKLPYLPAWTRQRQENAVRYHDMFQAAGLADTVVLPQQLSGREHVWNQYTIRVPNQQRDALRHYLTAAEIGTEIYYPVPLHCQDCFGYLGYQKGSLPETDRAAAEVLSLPIFPALNIAEQATVVGRIAEFFLGHPKQNQHSSTSQDRRPLASGSQPS